MDKLNLKDNVALHQFMKKHCLQTPYVFQVKKCLDADCSYCTKHPIQITPEQFSSLQYLPLPHLHDSKSYLPFEKVYGKEPSDKDRPSSQITSNSVAAEVDTQHKALLKNTKVRQVIFVENAINPDASIQSQD